MKTMTSLTVILCALVMFFSYTASSSISSGANDVTKVNVNAESKEHVVVKDVLHHAKLPTPSDDVEDKVTIDSDFPDSDFDISDDRSQLDLSNDSPYWGKYDSPWETPLFQWMEDPSLTHLPLAHINSYITRKNSRTNGDASSDFRIRRRERPRPDQDPLQSIPLDLSRQGPGTQSGTANVRLSQGYGQAGSHQGLPGIERPGFSSHSAGNIDHLISRHDSRFDNIDTAPPFTQRPQAIDHPQHRGQQQTSQVSRTLWDNIRSRPPLLGQGQSPISSLPHSSEQIVYKLPSETHPDHQSRPIVYEPTARRSELASRKFVTFPGLSRGHSAARPHQTPDHLTTGQSHMRRHFQQHTDNRFRIHSSPDAEPSAGSSAEPGGFDRRSQEFFTRSPQIPDRRHQEHYTQFPDRRHQEHNTQFPDWRNQDHYTHFPDRRPQEHLTQFPDRRHQEHYTQFPDWRRQEHLTQNPRSPDIRGKEYLTPSPLVTDSPERSAQSTGSDDWLVHSSGEVDASGIRNVDLGHSIEGHASGSGLLCRRHLSICQRTLQEQATLVEAYRKNLESIKLMLIELLDRAIGDPSHLLDQTLCDVTDVSSASSSRGARRQDVSTIPDGSSPTPYPPFTRADARRNETGNQFDGTGTTDKEAPTLQTRSQQAAGVTSKYDNSGTVTDRGITSLGVTPHQENYGRNVYDEDDLTGTTEGHSGHIESGAESLDLTRGPTRLGSGGDIILSGDTETGEDDIDTDTENTRDSRRRHHPQAGVTPDDDNRRNCQLGAWSEWSNPVGFGVIERRRFVVEDDEDCKLSKSEGELVMRVDISVFNANHTYYKAPEEVGQDFETDFTRSQVPRDLLLVLDASGSIEEDDFELMRDGVDVMVRIFCGGFGPSSTNNRLAIVVFASEVDVVHRFIDDQTPETLHNVIANMTQPNGNTCTGDALKLAHDVIFSPENGVRREVVHDTLLVTDGHSNCGEITVQEGAQLLKKVSNVFALGVGLANDTEARWEVNSAVSDNNPRHIFSLERFQDFKDMVSSIEERQKTLPCLPIVENGNSVPGYELTSGDNFTPR